MKTTARLERMMSKEKLSTAQLGAIYALLKAHGLTDEKESIVSAFTAERSTHISEMNKAEAAALIGHLKSLNPQNTGEDKMRNKILSMAHEMGWHRPEIRIVKGQAKHPVDMERVNNWCIKYGYMHKKLDAYTYNELPRLVSQFEGVYKDHLKG